MFAPKKISKYIQVIFVYRLRISCIKDYIIYVLIIQKQYINNLIEDACTIIFN